MGSLVKSSGAAGVVALACIALRFLPFVSCAAAATPMGAAVLVVAATGTVVAATVLTAVTVAHVDVIVAALNAGDVVRLLRLEQTLVLTEQQAGFGEVVTSAKSSF